MIFHMKWTDIGRMQITVQITWNSMYNKEKKI